MFVITTRTDITIFIINIIKFLFAYTTATIVTAIILIFTIARRAGKSFSGRVVKDTCNSRRNAFIQTKIHSAFGEDE